MINFSQLFILLCGIILSFDDVVNDDEVHDDEVHDDDVVDDDQNDEEKVTFH